MNGAKFRLETSLANMKVVDAGLIGPEGEDDHVEHELDVLLIVAGDFCIRRRNIRGRGFRMPGALIGAGGEGDLFFHGTDGFEVFVHLVLIIATESAAEIVGIGQRHIQEASIVI